MDYLREMGIQRWVERNRSTRVDVSDVDASYVNSGNNQSQATEVKAPQQSNNSSEQLDWQQLETTVASCQKCELCKTRIQTVFGSGNSQAKWLFVGEAPGAQEDKQGEAFVGRAGQLLNSMLLSIGMQRDDVYICNVLKCRPPNNRDPLGEEVTKCLPYLQRQIELVAPEKIITLGAFASKALLQTNDSIGSLRGRVHAYSSLNFVAKIPLIATYHPAYLLRSPGEKRKVWQDLKLALSC